MCWWTSVKIEKLIPSCCLEIIECDLPFFPIHFHLLKIIRFYNLISISYNSPNHDDGVFSFNFDGYQMAYNVIRMKTKQSWIWILINIFCGFLAGCFRRLTSIVFFGLGINLISWKSWYFVNMRLIWFFFGVYIIFFKWLLLALASLIILIVFGPRSFGCAHKKLATENIVRIFSLLTYFFLFLLSQELIPIKFLFLESWTQLMNFNYR